MANKVFAFTVTIKRDDVGFVTIRVCNVVECCPTDKDGAPTWLVSNDDLAKTMRRTFEQINQESELIHGKWY